MLETSTAVPVTAQKEKVRSFFDDSKPWQGDLYERQDDYFARVIRRRKDYAMEMVKELNLPPGAQALDIGCGSGVYLEELLKLGFTVTGVDLAAEMLTTCRNRLGAEATDTGRVCLLQGDVENIPLPDKQFDLVLCVGVFGYLLSDERAQAELLRVLKPGGYLILNLTNMFSLSDADFVLRRKVRSVLGLDTGAAGKAPCPDYAFVSDWMLKHRKYHFKAYNLRKYERILALRGLRKLDAMTYGFEFRILRRIRVIPKAFLNGVELVMERMFRKVRIPYFSYSGWVYTGVFRND